MNNEDTILDPQYNTEPSAEESAKLEQQQQTEQQPQNQGKKDLHWGEKAAYATGGAAVGAGLTAAGQAVAAPTSAEKQEPSAETDPKNNEEAEAAAAATSTNGTQEPSAETDPKNNEEAEAAAATSTPTPDEAPKPTEEVTGVTVEANGTTVHIAGNATVEVINDTIHVTTAEATPAQPAEATTTPQQSAPDPEDAIVATATGVRVAQVDDKTSFSQAFADARAQVGPGGVFEWHGRVYGTYYKSEWDHMTAQQKHEYQASIDYEEVVSGNGATTSHPDVAQHHTSHQGAEQHHTTHHATNVHHTSHSEPAVAVESTPTDTPDEIPTGEVTVLGTGYTDLNGDGIPENAAVVEIDGHEVLIVDVDMDGSADAAFSDINGDGEIEGAILTNQTTDTTPADTTPDYMNDASVDMYEC